MAKGSSYSTAARHEAQQILSNPPFRVRAARAPAPLAGFLNAIGRGLNDVFGKPLAWLWRHLVLSLHGALGDWTWVLLGALALGFGGATGVLLLRRRGAVSRQGEAPAAAGRPPNAELLERAAEEAEARGAHDVAVRLRFEAGLARLEARGVIASRLTTTTDGLRARLASPAFDRLADRHEAIAYAHETASKDDFISAGEGWSRVFEEARSKPDPPAEAPR